MRPSGEITERLLALRGGDQDALNQLVPLVYERLREIAHARLAGRGPGVDTRTVNRDWRAARALLYRALSGAEAT